MNKSTSLIKSGLFLIVCWLASVVIVMFFQTFYEMLGWIMCVAFGVCSVGACICIYGDFAWKLGRKMRLADERNGIDNTNFGWLLGLVPTVLNYITAFPVFLSKFGVIKYDFYPIYKLLNIYFVPWTYFTAPNTAEYVDGVVISQNVPASELSIVALIVIAILPLVFLFANRIAFSIGYNNIDVKEKVLYGK